MNGLTEKFFAVPLGQEDTYRELLKKPSLYAEDFRCFYDKMIASGFVLDDASSEQQLLKEKFENLRKPWEYSLMVLPTYACNLRCWYCVQKHENVNLTQDLFERLKKHIDKVVRRTDITEFKLWWFGGEPLIQYEQLRALNLHAKKRCAEYGLRFSANITTNATLLTPERIDALRESGVNYYQISIDGSKEIHDKVKVLHDRSAFDHALAMVDYIGRTTYCTLRFNYTKETLHPDAVFNDIDHRLSAISRQKISFLIYKVWQESVENIDKGKVDRLYNLAQNAGLSPQLPLSGLCYADYKNFFCVFPNGKVGKCDNHDIEAGEGVLLPDGDIYWPTELGFDTPILDVKEHECLNCNYLPICTGPCSSKREKALHTSQYIRCMYVDKNAQMQNLVVRMLQRMLDNQD